MIAIKDMPMPKNCYECWFEDANRCYLNILQHIESLDRPEWCSLVEVAEPRWIPVEQDCPKRGKNVLISYNGVVSIDWLTASEGVSLRAEWQSKTLTHGCLYLNHIERWKNVAD